MIKLIVSDIDGTLVPDGTDRIDPEMFRLIKMLKAHGVRFAGASGRQYVSMRKLFHPVRDDIFYITDNGSILRDKDRVYSMNVIDRDVLFELISDVKKLDGCDIMLCGLDTAYCEEHSEMFLWMRDSYKYNIQVLGDFETHLKDDIVKLSIYKKDTVEAEVKEWFYPKWKDRFVIASAGTMWMDIVNPGADKGSALKKLMKELELSKEEVMAFGDNINDLGMLEAAGESYAIGSARQEVKDAAKHIAPPLNIYGETIALREFLEKQGRYDTTLR